MRLSLCPGFASKLGLLIPFSEAMDWMKQCNGTVHLMHLLSDSWHFLTFNIETMPVAHEHVYVHSNVHDHKHNFDHDHNHDLTMPCNNIKWILGRKMAFSESLDMNSWLWESDKWVNIGHKTDGKSVIKSTGGCQGHDFAVHSALALHKFWHNLTVKLSS